MVAQGSPPAQRILKRYIARVWRMLATVKMQIKEHLKATAL